MKRAQKLVAVILAIVMVFSLGACSSSDSDDGLTKIKIGYMPNLISCSLAVIGVEEGYFEEAGFDVELVEFSSGPTEFAAMASGDLDIGMIGHGAHILAIQGDAEIFYFECLGNSDRVMALTSSGIATAADLEGKTIAYVAGTSSESMLTLTLASVGLSLDDVTLVSMDINGATAALISKQIDAAAIWSPSTATVESALGDEVITISSIGDFADTSPSPGSWIISEDMINNDYDAVVSFTAALYRANEFRANNLEQTAEYVGKLLGMDTDVIMLEELSANWYTAAEIYNFVTSGELDEIYDAEQQMFIDAGSLDAKVDVSSYFHEQIMLDAYDLYLEIK